MSDFFHNELIERLHRLAGNWLVNVYILFRKSIDLLHPLTIQDLFSSIDWTSCSPVKRNSVMELIVHIIKWTSFNRSENMKHLKKLYLHWRWMRALQVFGTSAFGVARFDFHFQSNWIVIDESVIWFQQFIPCCYTVYIEIFWPFHLIGRRCFDGVFVIFEWYQFDRHCHF